MDFGINMAYLLEKYKWFEWSNHTNFSFLKAAGHPEDFVNRALHLNYGGLGISDYDGVYGIVRAWKEGKKNEKNQNNFRLFYGAELHLAEDQSLPLDVRDTVIAYALNLKGYEAICRLITIAHQKGKHTPWISADDLCQGYSPDIVLMQPARGLVQINGQAYKERMSLFKNAFGQRFYQLFTRSLIPADHCLQKRILHCSNELKVPILCSQDTFFPMPDQKSVHDLVQAIRLNCQVSEASDFLFVNDERSLHTLREIEARYGSLPFFEDSLKHSQSLAEEFSFDLSQLRYRYPTELIPEGFDSQSWLEKSSYDAARSRYGIEVPRKIIDCLSKELSLVRQLGFADYFLTVWEIVRWARERGILCQGRGSAANSVICYVLGVTSVDPGNFDVLFERFLSVERGDPPDIDVDFEHERREEVIQHIYSFYGRERAAMVANVITFRTKGAIRSVGKALGISDEVINRVSEEKSTLAMRGESADFILKKCQKNFNDEAVHTDNIPWELWSFLTSKIKGYPRHLGIHSGGFVITGEALNRFSPVEPATMQDRQVIQWSKDDIESLGFFKIDILALGILTAMQKTFTMLKKYHGRYLSLAGIPNEDPSTYEMICRADTVGAFQIESRAQMSMLPRLLPKTFYDLVIQVAIIRPGPIQGGFIHPFLKRRKGQEPIHYAHPKLIPILKRTLGVPLFQEQVMRIAMAVGGFTPGEADQLRRFLGSWQIKGDIGPHLLKLKEGMIQEKIHPSFIDATIRQMEGFSAYGFPESHAVSFALIAYASSWLKCHYPEAFFASILNSQPMGFYSPHTLIHSAKRDGVIIRGPSINHSEWDYCLESTPESLRPFGIRMGLRSIRGIHRQAIDRLVARRNQVGSWHTFEDFLKENLVDRITLAGLAGAGAFAEFGLNRRAAIWSALRAPCFETLEEYEKVFSFPRETPQEIVDGDFSVMETSLYMHASEVHKVHYWSYGFAPDILTSSRQISLKKNHDRIRVFGVVIVRQAPPTAGGLLFLTLEDEWGFINCLLKPKLYEQYPVDRELFLCLEGKLQKVGECHSLIVESVIFPEVKKAEVFSFSQKKTHDDLSPIFAVRSFH